MRNLFDQYSQPENRLTHALMSCLAQDRQLLGKFIRKFAGFSPDVRSVHVLQQALPGDPPDQSEEEAERKGLPDGCLWTDQGWILLIESKIQAPVSADQIRRHLRTAGNRGFKRAQVLVLSTRSGTVKLPGTATLATWSELYVWLQQVRPTTPWTKMLTNYFETAEARLSASGYLTDGTLTVFSGIPFGMPDSPHNYREAKRIMDLLRDDLTGDQSLMKRLSARSECPGRTAITGRNSDTVWDFISLVRSGEKTSFTEDLHLTLGLTRTALEAYVTIPNNIHTSARRRMLGESYEDFEALIRTVTQGLARVVEKYPGAQPRIVMVQRRYPSQRAKPYMDCSMKFDPRTAIALNQRNVSPVKLQPQWLRAAFDALDQRRSNLQFQIGVEFPYEDCKAVASPSIKEAVGATWLACEPLVAATAIR